MPEGSARLKTAWYAERMQWLEFQGKPAMPDWSISEAARDISDLIEWDYLNPETAEETGSADIEADDMPLDLAEDAFLAQDLRLSPALKSALLRRKLAEAKDEHHSEVVTKKLKRFNLKKLARQVRKKCQFAAEERSAQAAGWQQQG